MKYLAVIAFALFLGACSNKSKTNTTSNSVENLKAQAQKMREALLKQDFADFTQFTYPEIVKKMGGKDKMVAIMENGGRQMEASGSKFLDATFGEPSNFITAGNELQCTLPQTIEMKVPKGRYITKSTMIAISQDGGNKWYFMDTGGKDIEELNRALPNLSTELVIPKMEKPVFYDE